MSAPDFVIVGGGVIGLSVALGLAREGASVTVLDAGAPGQASQAAAGMLAPLAESGCPGPFVRMALDSLRRWPSFVAGLREEAETPLDILGPGMLRVARTEAEEEALCAALDWQETLGLPLHRLDAAEVRALEPAVGPDVRAAVLSPLERHVEPRVLLRALADACRCRGVRVRAGVAVTGFATAGARVTGVEMADDLVSGGQAVIAGGAWSAGLGRMLGVRLPIQPLRGQILALGPQTPLPVRHTLYAHGGYLVPRPDRRIIAGATEEHAGFEARTTDAGIGSLLKMAATLVPDLAGAPLHSSWTGLRPVSADGLPLLGRVTGWDNVHVATGHGRNGILLTPITGSLMADHLLRSIPPPPAFDPARFLESSLCPSP
ncbi:MAG: glycine oxidase ThiO [Armatimonadetes bacterium]|nr:glycine oxidase ThiO [Armatimonadota bacterium]